jgi:hypothetical protein
VAVEDLLDEVVHLARLADALVEEAGRRVRDRLVVVADLEDRDALHPDGDLLLVDAGDLELGRVGAQRQVLGLLQHRDHELAAARDDLEGLAGRSGLRGRLAVGPELDVGTPRGRGLDAEARDDQRLVRVRDLPERLEQDRDEHDADNGRSGDDEDLGHAVGSPFRRVTSTVRGAMRSMTTISSSASIDPPSTSCARNDSMPPRIATSTSPRCPGRIAPCLETRPTQPTGDALLADIAPKPTPAVQGRC